MRLSRTFMGAVIAMLIVALAIVIGGKESNGAATVSAPTPPHQTRTSAVATPTQTATTTAATASRFPLVSFTYNQEGAWPFTAQIVSIKENTTGFPGTAVVSPGYTVLMVQVNITSKTIRSVVPGPSYLKVLCSGPNSSQWKNEYNDNGYDAGSESAPDPAGNNIALGDGQPHPWDAEWEVPEGTSTEDLRCSMEVQEHTLALN